MPPLMKDMRWWNSIPLTVPQRRRQTDAVEGGAVEEPLVGQVVDGEDGGGTLRQVPQQGRRQAGLPIVAVQHLGAPAHRRQTLGDLGDRPG